jgi:hypothetical protein
MSTERPGQRGPTPLSRSDPVLRFVHSRQKFVRWSQARVATVSGGYSPPTPGRAPHERVVILLAMLGGEQRVQLPADDIEAAV